MPSLSEMMAKARSAAMRRGVSREDAEDCVQEAYLKIDQYERRHVVRSKEALLVRAAVNLAIDKVRRSRRTSFRENDELQSIADTTPGPAQIVEQQIRLLHAAEGIDKLPHRTRRILLMRRLDNLPYAEIARRESMTVAAVEKQVARATLQLVQWMKDW
ncbi:sigma-70 family RNA polymerase sigma factor [Pelagerythrobacter aerophilus]|uniref:Sigma-70 family RNA polymerase sigma factor n=2 Tax=Pelagerythrobacter aerophilus TaxID=2306995 RepID=A0A418NF94_9SPHN|nr:sigma-70 family RNA polymerase sigma factor [Pelagerythrobacter aerophilus]